MVKRKSLTKNQKARLRKQIKDMGDFRIKRYYKTKQGEKVVLEDNNGNKVISSARKLYREVSKETKLRREEDKLIRRGHLSKTAWSDMLKEDRKAAFYTVVREHTQSDVMGRKEKMLRNQFIDDTTTQLKYSNGTYYKGRTTLIYTKELDKFHKHQEERIDRIRNKANTTYNERMLRYEAFTDALNKGLLKTTAKNKKYKKNIQEGNITPQMLEDLDKMIIEEYEIYEGEFYGWQQGNYETVVSGKNSDEYKARYIEFLRDREEYLEPYVQDVEEKMDDENLADELEDRMEKN